MSLTAGTRLGPYEIVSPLGAGGMGEVWRAKDTRVDRPVALKVLPEEFFESEEKGARFGREARTLASLNHPCIAVLYAFEEIEGRHILVMELLEGESLRALVSRGPLPVRRALEIAEQVAQGLAAAHEKGIVHRDVKPENVFVTKDGHVKVLDFGLARAGAVPAGRDETESPTVEKLTSGGAVVGTVAYMSPEQARGLAVDHRSDQFSLGVVLYEMLAGRRPFKGASAAETLTAIIREEPEPISREGAPIPAAARWIVERCLAKEPVDRYDSTRDLARELSSCRTHFAEAMSGAVEAVSPTSVGRRKRRVVLLGALAAAFVGVALVAGLVGRSSATRPEVKFQRLTFKRGYVTGARFAPDGRTVVYSAAWDGTPSAVYSIRLDALEPVPSGYPGANLLAVSTKSQLALSLQAGISYARNPTGMLALAPFAGGSPRELGADANFADFSRDGEDLAISRRATGGSRLEYPLGRVLYESPLLLSHLRISPSAEQVAFLEMSFGVGGDVVVVDRSGKSILRKGPFAVVAGLAWSPRGDELWFEGSQTGNGGKLLAITLGGRERVLIAAPVPMVLHDAAPNGRVLVSTYEHRTRLVYRGAVGPERELSNQSSARVGAISSDGSWVAFTDDSVNGVFQCYLSSSSGGPPVQLGPGLPLGFSPDGGTLVVLRRRQGVPTVVLQPVGPGQPTNIRLDGFEVQASAGLFPGGKAIWFSGNQSSRPVRMWKVAVSGGKPHPLTPEGVSGWVTDDGAALVFPREGKQWIQPLAGGVARPVGGIHQEDWVAAWSAEGKPLFVNGTRECPAKIYRLDPKTGQRELFREIGPIDATGVQSVIAHVTPDGKAYAYNVNQLLSELHLVEGLK